MLPISGSTSLAGLKLKRAGGFFKWWFLIKCMLKCDQNARFFLDSSLIKRKKKGKMFQMLLILYRWCDPVGQWTWSCAAPLKLWAGSSVSDSMALVSLASWTLWASLCGPVVLSTGWKGKVEFITPHIKGIQGNCTTHKIKRWASLGHWRS